MVIAGRRPPTSHVFWERSMASCESMDERSKASHEKTTLYHKTIWGPLLLTFSEPTWDTVDTCGYPDTRVGIAPNTIYKFSGPV